MVRHWFFFDVHMVYESPQRPNSSVNFGSRPHSANFFNLDNNSRPNSAVRSSSANSSRKSSSLNGPYLTENFKKPKQNGHLQNGQILFDKILSVAEAEDKKDNSEFEPNDNSEEKIEEIRIVKKAVSAFKKRRRLKDIKKKPKTPKLATIVEKIMQKREQEPKFKKRQLKRSESSNTTTSTLTNSSTNSAKSLTRPKRPESVAQKVLRERREKRIRVKTPETKLKPKTKQKEPLHVALRKSASKHGRSKAILAEKIKQKTHFDTMKEYKVRCTFSKFSFFKFDHFFRFRNMKKFQSKVF